MDEYENARRRFRRRLARQLVLQAEAVCESLDKEPAKAQEVLSRMLRNVIELRQDERGAEERNNDLLKHLRDCAKAAPYVEQDEENQNVLVLEGIFDLKKLSKRMFWYGHKEAMERELQCL